MMENRMKQKRRKTAIFICSMKNGRILFQGERLKKCHLYSRDFIKLEMTKIYLHHAIKQPQTGQKQWKKKRKKGIKDKREIKKMKKRKNPLQRG